MKITILIDNITRPTPRSKILPVVLDELNHIGVSDRDITVVIALGTHRYMTNREIVEDLGREVVNRVEVINHEWENSSNFVDLGRTENGTPVMINKKVYESDFIIGVGSVVPHV